MEAHPDNIPDDKLEEFVYRLYQGLNHEPLIQDTILEDKKLFVSKHEIKIRVEATVMEEDETGEVVSAKEVCKNTYRIPVPSNKDYHVFMKAFFDHMENSMRQGYEQASK